MATSRMPRKHLRFFEHLINMYFDADKTYTKVEIVHILCKCMKHTNPDFREDLFIKHCLEGNPELDATKKFVLDRDK